jgi:hypothetical protein
VSYPPGVLDRYFRLSGDTVQNIEINCTQCNKRELPLIYFDTYKDAVVFADTDVIVVHTIADMLYRMNEHVVHIHLEEVR